jgi:predicted RNA polymerase sigma factor
VATLIRVTGDWDLAEECAQDALASARPDPTRARQGSPGRSKDEVERVVTLPTRRFIVR